MIEDTAPATKPKIPLIAVGILTAAIGSACMVARLQAIEPRFPKIDPMGLAESAGDIPGEGAKVAIRFHADEKPHSHLQRCVL